MPAPLGADDLYRFRWIDHVRLSPDGERIAYQLSWADAESRQGRSRVVVRRLLDQEPVDATAGPRRDHSPEWSPDGRQIAFMSKRGETDQVFVLDVSAGSDARQVSSLPEGAAGAAWSPDGSLIAFISLALGDPDGVVDDPRPPDSKDQVRRTPVARVVRRLDYKHDGQGYVDGRYHHLFVVAAGGGEATQLTSGAWDVTGFSWSPDGAKLVVSGNAEPGSDLQRGLNLYIVDLAGHREKLTGGFDLASPSWSPRGDLIAFVAPNGLDAGLIERLWVVPAGGGNPRCLTISLDQAVVDTVISDMHGGHGGPRLCWSKNGDRLYFPSSGPGVSMIYSNDLEGNVWPEVGGQRRIFDFDVVSGVFAFCASDPTNPGELHVVMQGAEARLSDLNPWLRERYVAQPERHAFTAPDGWVIEGWLLKPQDFNAGLRYPLVLEVHGGPHAQYGWAFFHEMQILAGMGYLVLYVNPRGSDGYGEHFAQAVVRDWGGKDYIDLMTALDQLIERNGCVDTERIGIGGGSYGGYMTNWAIGQTDRFAAAVAMRSISNLVSEYSQHDIVLWGAVELGPPPYPDLDELWRRSPIRYVQQIKTPLLLTAGEMDLRCAMSQSEELFGAMRLLGKTVELVRFPDESHDLSRSGRPDRRVERLRRIAGWFERFLGTNAVEPSAAGTRALATVTLDQGVEADTQLLATRNVSALAVVAETVPPATIESIESEAPPGESEAPPESAAVEQEPDPEAIELAPVVEPEPHPVAVEPEPVPEPAPVMFEAAADGQAALTTQTLGLRQEDAEVASEPEALPVLPEPEPVLPEPVEAPAARASEPAAADTESPPPAPEPRPTQTREEAVAETVIAWPHGNSPAPPNNGSSDTSEEATSIIPAWQPSDAPPESKRTVSLAAVPPEAVAAGTGYPAKLTFESGPFAGRIIALPDQMVTFGRAPDNDIVVGDPATSGRHGRIEVRSGVFWISDLGSTNGTLVNGEPVIERELANGDMIAVGQNVIRFSLE